MGIDSDTLKAIQREHRQRKREKIMIYLLIFLALILAIGVLNEFRECQKISKLNKAAPWPSDYRVHQLQVNKRHTDIQKFLK